MQLQAKLDSTGIECLRELFEELALEAGRIMLDLRARGIEARAKADASPVTEADIQAERLICAGLARHFPAILIIAEESAAASRLPANAGAQFVLIDPLDGTREFIAGRDEYTVNLALVQAGQPVMGVILAPAHGLLYSGRSGLAERIRIDPDGKPGPREPIRVAPMRTPLRILASRSHRT